MHPWAGNATARPPSRVIERPDHGEPQPRRERACGWSLQERPERGLVEIQHIALCQRHTENRVHSKIEVNQISLSVIADMSF
jgi:hypothetical protein